MSSPQVAIALVGLGTAMVYPVLIAAVSDVADPGWRAATVGVDRIWRDGGYAVGAVLAGGSADVFGASWAIIAIGILTCASAAMSLVRTFEPRPARRNLA